MMYGYGNSMFLFNNGIIATPASNPLWNSLYAVYKAESNADDSLGVYDGTAQGGLTYGTGVDGNAFVSNGTNAYVALPNNTFDSLTGDFSVSANVYLTSIPSSPPMCVLTSMRRDSGNYYGFAILIDNGIAWLQISQGGTTNEVNLKAFGYPLTFGSWYNLIFTHSSSGSAIYINNVLRASNSSSVNAVFHPTLNYCSIGAQQQTPSYQYWLPNGSKIDELYVWNREITSDERVELQTTYY